MQSYVSLAQENIQHFFGNRKRREEVKAENFSEELKMLRNRFLKLLERKVIEGLEALGAVHRQETFQKNHKDSFNEWPWAALMLLPDDSLPNLESLQGSCVRNPRIDLDCQASQFEKVVEP